MIQDRLPKPAIFAHRGNRIKAPENSMAAFQSALSCGADGIELDTMLSADGVPVVIHDNLVNRTTDGEGKVSELSTAALKELDVGSWFAEEFKGERIPTLEEVLDSVGKQTVINIELKNLEKPFDELPEIVCNLVKKMGLEEHILFSSFNPIALMRAKKAAPEIERGLLTLAGKHWDVVISPDFRWMGHEHWHPDFTELTAEKIEKAHLRGFCVNTYTVNEVDDMRRLMTWEIDSIITDDPNKGLEIRKEMFG
ncbi:MAG: hypothetical protein JXA19_02630 [Anaerolineales bacterium]|nr:hypothetical protein [Anaerolineales bacterium]